MRLSIIAAAAAALASFAAASSASAQVGFGVYIGPSGYYDAEEYAPPVYRSRPRVYGYSSGYDDDSRGTVIERVPGRRGGCGEFFYWDGTACVDARSDPPNLR
jgi:hypothetical protein